MADRPAYNLTAIAASRDRLVTALSAHFDQQVLQADLFNTFVEQVRSLLPGSATHDAVFESCRYLLGRQFTAAEALLFAWRLAGNMTRLRAGRPVLPWAGQRADEWVPLQVLRSRLVRNKKGSIGTEYTFRVLAGTPAGMRIVTHWKHGLARLAAGKLGFSASWGKYPYHSTKELVGLRLYGLIEAARSSPQAPVFYQVDCPDSLVTWNRNQVLKQRVRIVACPQGWSHPCHKCVIGYNECAAGTHRQTYQKGLCEACGQAEALFDPEDPSPHCIGCTTKERLRRVAP